MREETTGLPRSKSRKKAHQSAVNSDRSASEAHMARGSEISSRVTADFLLIRTKSVHPPI